MNKCSKCKIEKTLSEFSIDKRYKDGLYPSCKKCKNAQARFFYASIPTEKRKAYASVHYQINKEKSKAYSIIYNASHKAERRNWDLMRRYGITLMEWKAMLKKQNNRCAICNEEFKNSRDIDTDHDHTTGKVRGLLCSFCNTHVLSTIEANLYLQGLEYLKLYE